MDPGISLGSRKEMTGAATMPRPRAHGALDGGAGHDGRPGDEQDNLEVGGADQALGDGLRELLDHEAADATCQPARLGSGTGRGDVHPRQPTDQ
jgi:hypothetical protein